MKKDTKMSSKKAEFLIVDTSAFIKSAPLQEIGENVITVQEVINEVTNCRQLKRLVVLPYDLVVKDVFAENIKFITEFAKKTGDYTSLSATDIKVMALTYQLEKEKVGTEHLKSEPTMQKTIKVTGIKTNNDTNSSSNKYVVEEETNKIDAQNNEKDQTENEVSREHNTATDVSLSIMEYLDKTLMEKFKTLDIEPEPLVDAGAGDVLVDAASSCEESESDETGESESDGDDWITVENLQEKKKDLDLGYLEDKQVKVACITTDFAMQNVLKQIGLNVTALDGRIIKQVRTFIFRCTTCFKTTSVMTKTFCPKCGHATLKRVSVSIDEHGKQQIHINGRRPLSVRGMKFSLPTPRGGQHSQYPILTEDQHVRDRKATRLARAKNNPMDADYIAGFSPFVMRDVNSKSAVLGIRHGKEDLKYWKKKTNRR